MDGEKKVIVSISTVRCNVHTKCTSFPLPFHRYDTNRRLWRVMYMENDKRKTRGFSPRIYGFNVARELAVQLKYEMNKKCKK
ncbi:transcription factor with AP2 domain(s) (ApiAP2) [Plasmodium ovale wallikeri]|uniref:Transcription factor with AP2 domain(S) (ApiAP2) n=1 Tax=Plasmodium ovale wallikeri TaxID=864142 RepID=A0A1A8YGA6_PLAOA|nr:transcription factor with AP2 domain(s) (ApiAP2) [Plasmodium ovale wallikeri]SBT31116.1 transcription factor with AP2 domain(s) (ApiAP2) [Plasmodium ovale wallikeri]